MAIGEVCLSKKEWTRQGILERLRAGDLSQIEAALKVGLSTRQVRRLLRRFEREGPAGLRSGHRGKKPNNWIRSERREEIAELIRLHYKDFGPTLAKEVLAEKHEIIISTETIRSIMIEAGLWQAKQSFVKFHPPRQRRARFGELIQIDGSPHDWFEGRAPRCSLLVFVDDATSQIVAARFVAAETTADYLSLIDEYIRRHGIPQAFYSDRHSIFRVNTKEDAKSSLTQYGRAMKELGIEAICANSPQAKGRVERANGVLQDRLVKAMRLAGINNWEAGNAFLSSFLATYNARFAKQPLEPEDTHVPIIDFEILRNSLCFKETRKLSRQLTCQYQQQWFRVLPDKKVTRRLIGAEVEIRTHLDGAIEIYHQGRRLAYERLEARPQAPVKDSKVVQAGKTHVPPSFNHPWRHPFSPNACFIPRSSPTSAMDGAGAMDNLRIAQRQPASCPQPLGKPFGLSTPSTA